MLWKWPASTSRGSASSWLAENTQVPPYQTDAGNNVYVPPTPQHEGRRDVNITGAKTQLGLPAPTWQPSPHDRQAWGAHHRWTCWEATYP